MVKNLLGKSLRNILVMTKFSRILFEAGYKEKVLPDGTVRREHNRCVWYKKDGIYHRLDGPALINRNTGYEGWFLNGKRHRTDGPALIITGFGTEEYWVNGKRLSKEEFHKHFGD